MDALAARTRHRPRRLVRLHRLLHRPTDARGRRPPRRRQPGPGPQPVRAREHDFEVLHFSQTVSLWSRVRDRIGAVPQRPAIAVSAGAVALGVGSRRSRLVVGLAQARQLRGRAPTGSSVAAETLRRDDPQCDEQCQYHELLDHGRDRSEAGPGKGTSRGTRPLAGTRRPEARPRRSAGPSRRCRSRGAAAWTSPSPRSGGSARASG